MNNLKQKLVTMAGVAGIVALGYAPVQSMEMQKLQELGKIPGIEKISVTYRFFNSHLLAIENEKVFKDKTITDLDYAYGAVPDGKTDAQYVYKIQKDGKLRLEEKIWFLSRGPVKEKWHYEIKNDGTVLGYGDNYDNGSVETYVIERPDGTKEETFNYGTPNEWTRKTKTLPDGRIEEIITEQDGSEVRRVITLTENGRERVDKYFKDGTMESYERLIKTLNLPDGETVIEEHPDHVIVIRTTFEINF